MADKQAPPSGNDAPWGGSITDSKLTDREIIRELWPRLYPWDESRCRVCGWPLAPGDLSAHCYPENCSMRPPPDRRADEPPELDDNAARLVRNRIAALHLTTDYCEELCRIVKSQMPSWLFVQATPRQQCEAALKALDGRKT